MQHLEVTGAVRPIYGSLCLKRLMNTAEMLLQVSDTKILKIEDKIKSTFPELERLRYNMLF